MKKVWRCPSFLVSGAPVRGDSRPSQRQLHTLNALSLDEGTDLQQFSNGAVFSPIIVGTWQLGGGHGRAVFDHVFDRLKPHAEAGFTSFDTADIYGPSEEIIGQLQSNWTASGNKPLQVFTKYVPNLSKGPPTPEAIKSAVKKSRRALQVQQIDLIQLHWWDYDVPGLVDTMLVLADLQANGQIQSLGVTNLDTRAVERLTDADIMLVSNQVQFSLLDRRPLGPNGMLQLCKERGMKLLCYGVVAGGLLTDRYLQPSHSSLYGSSSYKLLDLDTSSLKLYWNMVQRFGGEGPWRRLVHVLRDVADKHQTGVANVATKWVMSQGSGGIAYPIIGARNANHIVSNRATIELELDAEDFDYIDESLRRSTPPKGDIYSYERQ